MKRNKKAISALVATVMVILITMAAVGVVWQIVIPLIKTSMETSKMCSNARLMVNTDSGYTIYDSVANKVSVMVSRGELEVKELEGVQIKVLFDGKSKTFDTRTDVLDTTHPVPGINEDWTYTVDWNETGTPSKVAIAAILKVGVKDHFCQITPSVSLEEAEA